MFGLDLTRSAFRKLLRLGSPVERVRTYDAAAGTPHRFNGGAARFGPYATETAAARIPIQGRARYFVENNPYAANGTAAFVTAAVGAGVVATSQHPNRELRRRIEAVFKSWVKRADADGRTDWYGLQAAAVRAMFIDGEVFVHVIATEDGVRLRLIPAEMIDSTYSVELGGERRVVAGVEFDADGRRVAYWIHPARPTDLFPTYAPAVRVPAEDVIHLFEPAGPGAVRGVSRFASVLLRLSELDASEDAAQVAIKVSALLSVILTNENDMSGDVQLDEEGLVPGGIFKAPGGWKVTSTAPQQAQQVGEFLSHMLRSIAAGLGVPEHLLTGDLRNANYSSLRASLVSFRQRIEAFQFHVLAPVLLQPVFDRVITAAALSGDLDMDAFAADPDAFLSVEWIPPAQPWVDPLKDAEAAERMVAAGFASRRQVVAGLGYAVEALDVEIASDREREASLGLAFGARPTAQEEESAS